MNRDFAGVEIAVIIPCHNEETAIGLVISALKSKLPSAQIIVCDNNSTDKTADVAKRGGARVVYESRPGKGHAVRRLLQCTHADVIVMIDGDGTYDVDLLPDMIEALLLDDLDMVVGHRVEDGEGLIYRRGHRFGNRLFNFMARSLFNAQIEDMFSGLRVFSSRFIRSFCLNTKGFELETDLTVFALKQHAAIREVKVKYRERPAGSHSKLNKYKDGLRILTRIFVLFVTEKPLSFFGTLASLLAALVLVFLVPVFVQFLASGTVPKFPTLIGATGLGVASIGIFFAGLIFHLIEQSRNEARKLIYNALPPPHYAFSKRNSGV